jgi:hypothetical protein
MIMDLVADYIRLSLSSRYDVEIVNDMYDDGLNIILKEKTYQSMHSLIFGGTTTYGALVKANEKTKPDICIFLPNSVIRQMVLTYGENTYALMNAIIQFIENEIKEAFTVDKCIEMLEKAIATKTNKNA